jgi:hypothetical protein
VTLVAKAENRVETLTAEVADLKDDISWGMYSKDNEGQRKLRDKQEELRSAERALTAAKYDSAVAPGISVDRLDRLAAERRHIYGTIEAMARRIAVMRNKCVRGFNFKSVERHEINDFDRDEWEYRTDKDSTEEFLHVTFMRYYMCDGESAEISFPLTYLDDPDWEKTEADVLRAKEEARLEALTASCRLGEEQRILDERAQYERLSKIYGPKPD